MQRAAPRVMIKVEQGEFWMENVILIGMPGSGKSTIGVLLAKALGYRFVDTDIIIQAETGSRLQTLLDTRGTKGFLQLEEEILSRVKAEKTVIATGGSAVFGPSAMAHMRELGIIVYLDTPVDELAARLANLDTRGVVMKPGEQVSDILRVRAPLYQKYADLTIQTGGLTMEQTVEALTDRLHSI